MSTRTLGPDTTIYIIVTADPQWISAADTPEKAVAEAIRGIGLDPRLAKPYTVYESTRSAFLPYEKKRGSLRKAMWEAIELRADIDYDHYEAVRLARERKVPKFEEPPCERTLIELS
jgi:hypothetical protein